MLEKKGCFSYSHSVKCTWLGTLITGTLGLNLLESCCMTSASRGWCFSTLRIFIIRTIAAWIINTEQYFYVLYQPCKHKGKPKHERIVQGIQNMEDIYIYPHFIRCHLTGFFMKCTYLNEEFSVFFNVFMSLLLFLFLLQFHWNVDVHSEFLAVKV